MIPWEIFIKKYNESSSEIKALIDSDKIPSLSQDVLGTEKATTKEIRALTMAISDYVLGLITKDGLKASITAPEENILTLFDQIGLLQKNTLSEPSTPQQPATVVESRPLTREELMQKLSPRRTMVGDVSTLPDTSHNTPTQGYEAR